MSRIGKKPISVPAGVKVTISGSTVTIAGGKHTLTQTFHPKVKIAWTESEKAIRLSIDDADKDDRQVRASWGTARSIIQNMIDGVTKGYEKSLEVVGVGWVAAIMGKKLKLTVGYANSLMVEIPAGLEVTVDKQIVKVKGPDKKVVGQFAAEVRARRKPEPYNGKGIKYTNEVIRRKQGKQFGS